MRIDLLNESLLGHWEIASGVQQCELQFGIRLIYVQHPDTEAPQRRLALAQQQVQATWDEIPQALAFAEGLCDPATRTLWQLYEQGVLQCAPLEVYSIHFDLDSPYPSYCISHHPEFDWNATVRVKDELGEEHPLHLAQFEPHSDLWLSVRRLGVGHYQNAR